MRFEGEQPQHVIERIADIGALGRRASLRDQPQPHQAHRMIDPHSAGVAQACPQGGEERLEAGVDERVRRKADKAPILSRHIEAVRWRADAEAGQQIGWSAPRVAAGRVHADRQIGYHADTHAGSARVGLGARERTGRKPLQEEVIANFPFVRRREARDGISGGVMPIGRPVVPVYLRFRRGRPVRMDRLEQCLLAQPGSALMHEAVELGRVARGEGLEGTAQVVVLGACRVHPVDQRRVFQPRPGHRWLNAGKRIGRIGVKRIEEKPVRR